MFETDNLWALGHSHKDSMLQSWAHTLKANNEDVCQRIHDTSVENAQMDIYTVTDLGEGKASVQVLPNETTNIRTSGGTVAVIPIIGAMQKDFSYYYKSTSTKQVIRNIQLANADPDVNSIVLAIDSGGGTVSGTYELGQAIKNSRKPVLGAILDSCCSAALWAGSQTQFLYATTPTAGIGSIGVITSHQEVSQLLDAIGIKVEFITSTGDEAKAFGNSVEPLSDDARKYIKDRLNETKVLFKATVLKGRGDRISNADEAITAKVVTPKTAKNLGLIDGTMSLENVIVMANRQGKKFRREESQKRSTINKPKKARSSSSSNTPLNTFTMSTSSRIDKYIKVVHKEERTLTAEQLNQLENSVEVLETKVDVLEKDLADAKQAEINLKEQLADATKAVEGSDALSASVDKLTIENKDLANQVTEVTAKLTTSEEEVTKLNETVSAKDTQIADLEAKLKASQEEVVAAKAATPAPAPKAEVVEETAEAKALKELEAKMASMSEEYNKLAAQVADPEKKAADVADKKDKKETFSYADLRKMTLQERFAFEKRSQGAGRILNMGAIRN